MKKLTIRLVVLGIFLIGTNLSYSNTSFSTIPYLIQDQEEQNKWEKEQEAKNKERNDEAVETLNEIIKNLEAEKKHDKAEALKAMRDYIKSKRKKDTGTTLDQAADKAKEVADTKEDTKKLKEYIDKIHSALAKKVFDLNFVSRGTGRTTGHIITLSVQNPSDQYLNLIPELVYIPSTNKYQSYVGYVPDAVTVAPGTTVDIPVMGYCANPHVPPVPSGESSSPPSEWISIDKLPKDGFQLDGNPPMIPEPMNPPGNSAGPPQHTVSISVSDDVALPSFDPGMIGTMTSSSAFIPDSGEEDPGIAITWPGTQEEMGGTVDPNDDTEIFAQLTVEGLTLIIDEVDSIQNSGLYTTPFSHDKEREKQAIIQQSFWIFVAGVGGEDYDEEDFEENVYGQFEEATGTRVAALPPEQKERIDKGVDDFWNVYTAVGVSAKVFKTEPTETIPISNPEDTDKDCCESMASHHWNPELDFDMKIADQWADATERRKLVNDAKTSMQSDIDIFDEEVFDEFDISKNPTSATSFWKPGVVGGFASAHAKTWFRKSDGRWEWVWGTERLNTDAGGTMRKTLSYDTGDDCRALVAGTALIRIRASSSAFDPVAGNRHNENETDQLILLEGVKYSGKLALEWLILRGRGKTNKPFKDFVKDDIEDKLKDKLTEEIEAEIQDLADKHLKEYLDALGLSAEDLSLDKLQLPDLEESLEELLGIDIPTLGDLEEVISEGIEASMNLFFVANTYATADGNLIVSIGGRKGSVHAHTSIFYGREALESTADAMTWSGAKCQQNIVSDVRENALTISTDGNVNMTSEAVSKYGFGNGSAKAYLESMNLQMLAGLCIYEENDSTKFKVDAVGSLHWYGNSDKHQSELKQALSSLENEILDGLTKEVGDFQKKAGNTSLENYTGQMLKDSLEEKIRKWAKEHPYYWKDCSDN